MYVRSTKLEKTSLSFANGLSANGDGEIRTLDPLLARQVLSQLSYAPLRVIMLLLVLCSDFLCQLRVFTLWA